MKVFGSHEARGDDCTEGDDDRADDDDQSQPRDEGDTGHLNNLWLAVGGRFDARRGNDTAERGTVRTDTRRHRSGDSLLEYRAERRNPGREPANPERVADTRRHAAAFGWHDAEPDARDGRIGNADADAGEHHPWNQDCPARVGSHCQEREDAAGSDRDAATEHEAGREFVDGGAEDERYEEGEHRHRQQAQAAAERRVAEVVLQVQGEVRDEGEHSAADGEGAQRDSTEAGFAKEREVKHWPGLVEFDEDEDDKGGH